MFIINLLNKTTVGGCEKGLKADSAFSYNFNQNRGGISDTLALLMLLVLPH